MQKTTICANCGRRTTTEDTGLPKGYRACDRCGGEVCSGCIDWTAGTGKEVVCGQCSGRNAPRQGGCD